MLRSIRGDADGGGFRILTDLGAEDPSAESRVAVAEATGQTVAGIADSLDCAESTVKTHLKGAYRKLGIRKQTELVQRVLSLEVLRQSFR